MGVAWIGLGLRLALAAAFAVAALGKISAPARFRDAVREFGVPRMLAMPVALVVPAAELLVAGALLPDATALAGAVGAGVLLVVFSLGVVVNLALGRRPDCGCFGAVIAGPIGTATIVRNALLLALAVAIALLESAPPAPGAEGPMWAGGFASGLAAIAVVLLGWTAWSVGRIAEEGRHLVARLEALEGRAGGEGDVAPLGGSTAPLPGAGLPVGAGAPGFFLDTLEGGRLALEGLLGPRVPVLIVFTDPTCRRCAELVPYLQRWQAEAGRRYLLVVVSRRTVEENQRELGEAGIAPVLLQQDRETMDAYGVTQTPSMVVVEVGPAGRPVVARPVAAGSLEVLALYERVVADLPGASS